MTGRMPWWKAMTYLLIMACMFSVAYIIGELVVYGRVTIL